MNPIAQKILDCGGTVLSEPLFVGDSKEINPKCADQLFAALEAESPAERKTRLKKIWKRVPLRRNG